MTAENQKLDVSSAFTVSRKRVKAGDGWTERQDYELSRFAAYLAAMNGDPNKPEVADAQAYFAVQTHFAEQAMSSPFDPYSASLDAGSVRSQNAR